jgi:hypothetical protein
MKNIKLLEYSQGKQFLEFYKKDSIENEEKYFCCYDYDFSTFTEVAMGRLLFDYQILIYCEYEDNNITNYIVFRVPLLIENSTALAIMIMNTSDSEFLSEVLKLISNKFKTLGWSKSSICILRYQLTEKLSNLINEIDMKEEVTFHSSKPELDRINYSYVF